MVRNWEGYRLARASRYLYRTAPGTDLSAPVEPSTFAAHFVRLPFKRFGRNPYLRPYAQDTSAPVIPSTWSPFLVRVPFRRLGRNPYLRHSAQDADAPAVTFNAAWAKGANVLIRSSLVA